MAARVEQPGGHASVTTHKNYTQPAEENARSLEPWAVFVL